MNTNLRLEGELPLGVLWKIYERMARAAGILFCCLLVFPVFSQQSNQLSGVITNEDGEPLPGVNVVVKGTTKGTVTDIDGEYNLQVSADKTLIFSYVGYRSQKIQVNGRSVIDVIMVQDIAELDEVVVVGYGTQQKGNLTGAISQIKAETLEERNVATLTEALQGAAANLNIESSSFGGEPGSDKVINIRGAGTLTGNGGKPYVLVDGMPMNISEVNPANVESISILKDAAASAVYGARAAFGVILIQTKDGARGERPTVEYNSYFSMQHPTVIPDQAESVDVARAINYADANANSSPTYNDEYMKHIVDYYNGEIDYETIEDPGRPGFWDDWYRGNANNDWQDMLWDHWALRQKHNLSLSGGLENTKYYVSLGAYDEDGIMAWGKENYKRYNLAANISTDVTDWFTVNFNTKYMSDVKISDASTSLDRTVNWHSFVKANPLYAYRSPDGDIISNQVIVIKDGGEIRRADNSFWAKIGGVFEPIEGWETNISYSWNTRSNLNTSHGKTNYRPKADGGRRLLRFGVPVFHEAFGINKYNIFNARTSYEISGDSHYFKILAGYEQEYKELRGLSGWKNNLVTNEVPSISTATGDSQINDSWTHWATQGIFMRLRYNFKEKYLLELNGRYDGSSRFQNADQKWGVFPSASVGYNISKEPFWNDVEDRISVSNFKLRASYGSLGNQGVPNYLYMAILPIQTNLGWIMGDERPDYTTTPSLVSPDLSWETISTLNFGVDAGFFRNRLNTTFDWYNRTATDMFGPSRELPAVLGTNPSQQNNAELETKGYDLTVSWRNSLRNDLNYNIQLTLGESHSTVTEYRNPSSYLGDWYVGKKLGEIWGYETQGIFQSDTEADDHADQSALHDRWQAGDVMYKDLNGDGSITWGKETLDDHGDLKVIGNGRPRYRFGVRTSVNYKAFDFTIFFTGVGKHDVIFSDQFANRRSVRSNGAFWGFAHRNYRQNAYFKPHQDFWSPEGADVGGGPDAYYPRPYSSNELYKNAQPQTRYMLNGAYIRLKQIKVGYTIPQDLTKKVRVQKIRIFLAGENIFTIADARVKELFDPEGLINTPSWGGGKYYPLQKYFSIGLNLSF